VCVADTATGEVKTLIEERLNTYVEIKPLTLLTTGEMINWWERDGGGTTYLEIKPLSLLSTGEMIHWSERDGWGHYYLFDANGTLKTQLTSGEFVCREIEGVHEKTRTLYFSATGRESNEDPYYSHVYSVSLNGGAVKLLDPGN